MTTGQRTTARRTPNVMRGARMISLAPGSRLAAMRRDLREKSYTAEAWDDVGKAIAAAIAAFRAETMTNKR